MSKTHTELALTGLGDIAVTLELENINPGGPNASLEIARVGDIAVTLTPQSLSAKNEALETAAFIEAVTNNEGRTLAINTVATLKAYTNAIEKSRKDVKQPFWDAGKAIDEIAKKESEPVLAEIRRVEKLLADYQREEDRKAAELLRQQQEEERKRQAEEAARLAEEQRLREEAEQRSREAEELAKGKSKLAQAQADLARTQAALAAAQANTLAADRRADEEAAKFTVAPVNPDAPTRPAGASVRKDWEFEVTDWDALYRAYGFRFIKMELDAAALRYHLGNEGVDHTQIAGVKITPVTKVAVRAAKA